MLYFIILTDMSLYLAEIGIGTASTVGYFSAASMLVIFLAGLVFSALTKKLNRYLVPLGIVLYGFGFLLESLAHWTIAIAVVAIGFAQGLFFPMSFTKTAQIVPKTMKSSYEIEKKNGFKKLMKLVSRESLGDTPNQLKWHMNFGLKVGITPNEITEIATHCIPFCGFPRALNAVGVAKQLFAEQNIEVNIADELLQKLVTLGALTAQGEAGASHSCMFISMPQFV
ncbi:carboxymuconolactone decarboxylase family protein [Paenibacillus protaetiae]|uniref:carboxymuconolactone decarboxylase family protein n=1 Tax=Paenibacillus protaetiae TaxID=2509456 RepID=UPI001ABE3498|nr:carboxymuconolactone decarboxylase family protein [Paenibacillus protaetiae]